MPVMVDQQILGFEVPIDDVLLVQVHQSVEDLNEVESSIFLGHAFDGFEVVEEFASGTVWVKGKGTIEDEAHEVVGLEAVVQLHDEGVVEHGHDGLLVLDDVFLLVLADEAFEHDLHGVELSISETANEVDFAKAPDGEALAYFVSFEPALGEVLQAVEGGLAGEESLSDGDLVVEEDVLVDGFEAYDLPCFEERVGIPHIQQISVDLLVEDVG